ncbi:MAG: DUF58 domain-containing protein, partial [Candidatus Gracilibacteria bacterium]|nr:DUF58 domain-containing protein [Candidatus Gracilibacteria bacterium]
MQTQQKLKHKQLLDIKTTHLVENISVGNHKTNFKAGGIEFSDFREYIDGEDAKNVDFQVSSREGKMLVKLFEEERELSIYLLPFFEENIDVEYGNISKRKVFNELLYIIGLSTIKLQNRIYERKKEICIFILSRLSAYDGRKPGFKMVQPATFRMRCTCLSVMGLRKAYHPCSVGGKSPIQEV